MGKLLKVYLMPHPPIMIHEIGRGEEEKVKNTIDSALQVAEEIEVMKPETIIIVVPPHGPAFEDAMSINTEGILKGDLSNFGASQIKFNLTVDTGLIDIIMKKSSENNISVAPIDVNTARRYSISNDLDHGSMIPLYFINKKFKQFKIVHITYGLLSREELYHFGNIIRESVEESERDAVLVASGDLSHRLTPEAPAGYSPLGLQFDNELTGFLKRPSRDEIMSVNRELVDAAGECGYRSILVMLGALNGVDVLPKALSYEGPFGVGYCVASYDIIKSNKEEDKVKFYYEKKRTNIIRLREQEDEYVSLARESLEHYIKTGKTLELKDNLPSQMLNIKAGTFVSLKKNGQLRGCIGTIEGVQQNIALEIAENAISAGTRDPRFYPVDEDELGEIEYSVDVLGGAEPISSENELDPKRYGVIVTKDSRSGLLLPNLEGVDTVDEQVKIALNKAGINKGEDYSLERFEVIRHR